MTTEKIFHKVFNESVNFITPEIVGYRKKDNYHIEISKGDRLLGGTIYGVTIIEETGSSYKHRNDLSTCFHSCEEIEDYIAKLK